MMNEESCFVLAPNKAVIVIAVDPKASITVKWLCEQLHRETQVKFSPVDNSDLLAIIPPEPTPHHLLQEALEAVVWPQRTTLPGSDRHQIYSGQSILEACRRAGIVRDIFPLHEPKTLKELRHQCWTASGPQLNILHDYFGPVIAIYFAFVRHYAHALLVPSIVGFTQWWLGPHVAPLCTIINLFWCQIWLKLWRRKMNEMSYRWNVGAESWRLKIRPGFRSNI